MTRRVRFKVVWSLGLLALGLPACSSLDRPRTADEACGPLLADCPPAKAGHHPIRVCENPTVMTLATDLDHLERHIDWYGSVVAKVPDVWGQARLTQYREDFEKEMAKELSLFSDGLQGSLSRSDSAYLASATALSFAAQPKPPVVGSVTSNKGNAPSLVPVAQYTAGLVPGPDGSVAALTKLAAPAASSSSSSSSAKAVTPIDLGDPAALVSKTDTVIGKRNDARLPAALAFGQGPGQIGIEPTEHLAQKKRFLDYLAQIRRENEGDDASDAPGYSLNLLRIPVSVLPGKHTDKGYGAEITMTLNPVLSNELLPATFRTLLTNDLLNQFAYPITEILNEDPTPGRVSGLLNKEFDRFIRVTDRINGYLATGDKDRLEMYVHYLNTEPGGRRDVTAVKGIIKNDPEIVEVLKGLGIKGLADRPAAPDGDRKSPEKTPREGKKADPKGSPKVAVTATQFRNLAQNAAGKSAAGRTPRLFTIPPLSFSNGLDNRTALPTSQVIDAYGTTELFGILYKAYQSLNDAAEYQGYAHLPDVQSFLRDETRAAGQFLERNPHLWAFCTDHLVRAVRSQSWEEVESTRYQFRKAVALVTGAEPQPGAGPAGVVDFAAEFGPDKETHFSVTSALAWSLVVDAALLTDRLLKDMRETAAAKQKPLPAGDHWCEFYLPNPSPECRAAFNEYVKLRWPIHVFALDPEVQEQNIGDSLSTRREMQLALAIAFTNGQISARQMTSFTRRLEAEYQTIALNRTQVGFTHGENVFGWRFYPRFQTPDTRSNLEVIFREQLIGGPNRNQLLRDRRLEPGIRECVAVVAMPAFVPYVTVDTSSNWFPLPNPKHKALDTSDAVRLSRAVQTIKTCAPGVKDAACYRDGEFDRLVRKAEQLEARLPLQTLTSQVSILNTYGGFEMFANGTTDLAPELFGWYGAPGIDPTAETTTLFLVGDHFSPLRSRVIVGNQVVDSSRQRMLSRQVMEVTFLKGSYPLTDDKGKAESVRVHVATPYGVTRELDVPVCKQSPKADPTPGFSFAGAKLTAYYGQAPVPADPKAFVPVPRGADGELKLNWVAPGNTLTPQVEVAFEFTYQKTTLRTAVVGDVRIENKTGVVVISKGETARLAAELVGLIAHVPPPPPLEPNPLDKGLTSAKVTVRPLAPPPFLSQGVETVDQLKVEFKAVIGPPPGPHGHPPHSPPPPHGHPPLLVPGVPVLPATPPAASLQPLPGPQPLLPGPLPPPRLLSEPPSVPPAKK